MSNAANIGRSADEISIGTRASPYTGVEITVNDETVIKSGNTSGSILRLSCPWGTQDMADSLLRKFTGISYQPFTAARAVIDPAVGIGGSLSVSERKSGLFRKVTEYGPLMRSNISAPGASETEHEYEYISKIERELTRARAGAAGGIALANKAIDGIRIDQKALIARVDEAEAGIRARVMIDDFNQYKEAQTEVIAKLNENLGSTLELLATEYLTKDEAGNTYYTQSAAASLTARVDGAESGLKLKADSSTVTSLSGEVSTLQTAQATLETRVGNAETALGQKASTSTVTDLAGRVTTNESAISSLTTRAGAAEAALLQKADSTTVTDLNGRVTKNEEALTDITTRVGNAETSLSQKASSKSVTDLSGRVSTVETAQTNLETRVGEAETSLSQKASTKSVTDLSGRVTTVETAQASLETRVGNAETSLSQKASSKSVTDLAGRVSTVETAQSSLTTRIGTVETGLSSKVSTQAFEDAMSGKLGVTAASTLYAKKDDISAYVGAYVMADGTSLADIKANLVTISGKTEVLGKLSVKDGALSVGSMGATSITTQTMTITGSITGNERTTISSGTLACKNLTISGSTYTATDITSTDGKKHSVLGHYSS